MSRKNSKHKRGPKPDRFQVETEHKPVLKLDQVQTEIIDRVMEEELAHEEIEVLNAKIDGAIEALEDIDNITEAEKRRIALEVKNEYLDNLKKRSASKWDYHRGLFIALAAVIPLAVIALVYLLTSSGSADWDTHQRVVFASKLNEKDEPANRVSTFILGETPIHLCIFWQHLPEKKHDYRIRVTDGAGVLVWSSNWTFTNKYDSHFTRSTYTPKPAIDHPGKWHFAVYLDGEKRLEETVLVKSKQTDSDAAVLSTIERVVAAYHDESVAVGVFD